MSTLVHTVAVEVVLALQPLFAPEPLSSAQGGGSSPFESAHLPFEELKSPPDSAFDVVLAAATVFLLAGVAAAAFLALSKLGAIERAVSAEGTRLREEHAQLRAEVTQLRAALAEDGRDAEEDARRVGETVADSVGAALTGPIGAGVDRVVAALEARDPDRGEGAADLAARLGTLADALERTNDRSPDSAALTAAVERGVAQGLSAAPEIRAPADSGSDHGTDEPLGVDGLETRIRERLLALGYEAPAIVTALEELGPPAHATGSVVVEARRDGAVHKGRVVLEDGAVSVVELQPGHRAFP